MKKLGALPVKPLFFLLFAVFFSAMAQAQHWDKSTLQDAIASRNFVFRAETVLPMSGSSRQLTSEYEVKFLGDSVVAYLPYFGRAYSAGYGEGGGIDFTSTKFDYKSAQRKKGGWYITVAPQDAKDVRAINMSVSASGYANLQVISNNRQPISFNGYLVKRK